MDNISLKAYAKVNLSLDILSKRDDGYHDICMIMQSIGVYDKVNLTKTKEKHIKISSNIKGLCIPERNIMYKAAMLLYEKFDIKEGLHINLYKRIPMGAGMAGGSTDAAAVLKGMNILFDLGLDKEELMETGLEIGADVPFCICGGTMLAEGVGERLSELRAVSGMHLVLVKPYFSVSTKEAYSLVDLNVLSEKERPDTAKLLSYIEEGNIAKTAESMKNVFELYIGKKYPMIEEIKKELIKQGALGAVMTGSGSVVFGVFEDTVLAKKCYETLKKKEFKSKFRQVYLSEFTKGGL